MEPALPDKTIERFPPANRRIAHALNIRNRASRKYWGKAHPQPLHMLSGTQMSLYNDDTGFFPAQARN
jgi:hypothetical protein